MGRPVRDRTGEVFGNLTVEHMVPKDKWRGTSAEWVCRCVCGSVRTVVSGRFRMGRHMTCMQGACHPGWAGNDVEYPGAHWRLKKALGFASSYTCVDCPKQAHDWSYKDASGYSLNPADYAPRCVSCHRLYDFARRG